MMWLPYGLGELLGERVAGVGQSLFGQSYRYLLYGLTSTYFKNRVTKKANSRSIISKSRTQLLGAPQPAPPALVYSSLVRGVIRIAMLAPALVVAADGQTWGKAEFEVASIKTNAPQPGFHFAADAATGGPGTADPGMFRCSKCSLATLIVKAFNLQPYEFPGRTSLTDNTYEILAKIPTRTTGEEFSAMLQNLLKERFGLAWHFQEKKMKGYHLVIAKDGPKLR